MTTDRTPLAETLAFWDELDPLLTAAGVPHDPAGRTAEQQATFDRLYREVRERRAAV